MNRLNNKMSNVSKVNTLTVSLTSDEKNGTKAYFNIKGNLNIEETSNLIKDFNQIVSQFKVENVENIENKDQVLSSEEILIPNNHQFVDNSESNQLIMHYPSKGTMKLSQMTSHRDNILEAWNTYSSILVKRSNPVFISSIEEVINYYRIVFPKKNSYLPSIVSTDLNEVPDLWKDRSYPVCSCPAYHYGNYHYLDGNTRRNGGCKHIAEALNVLGIDFTKINWSLHSNNMSLIFKQQKLDEFQWI